MFNIFNIFLSIFGNMKREIRSFKTCYYPSTKEHGTILHKCPLGMELFLKKKKFPTLNFYLI